MEVLAEALAALDGRLELAPEKIPAGATVVAVQLDRDPARSGRYMTATDHKWLVPGMALAIRDGHVVRANCVFGRYTDGRRLNGSHPKVSACHWVVCPHCGERQLMPLVVWHSKRMGESLWHITVPEDKLGLRVLRGQGVCPKCNGGAGLNPGVHRAWSIDDEGEKADLTAFSERVLQAISDTPGPIPAFLPPTAFKVVGQGTPGSDATLPPEWEWLNKPLLPQGKVAVPYNPALAGSDLVYNPGFWLGFVHDPDSTGLFWKEGDGSGHQRGRFNPSGVEGL